MASAFFLILVVQLFTFFIITINTCNGQNQTSSPKFPAILVFGDSTVDTGNNNYVITIAKGDHAPYGENFPGRVATGRFSDGKLVPDLLVSMLGLKETVPPFLQPNLSDDELLTGVSFASGGSGYDDLTADIAKVIPMSEQPGYFEDYIEMLKRIVGEKKARRIVNGALVIISAGTNDFVFNFYDIPTRRLQFDIDDYQDFVQERLHDIVKKLYDLGGRTMAIAGLPPIGCLPIQMTVKLKVQGCVRKQNADAQAYNDKLVKLLPQIQASLPGSNLLYADIYNPLIHMINNPAKYGFEETKRGCCGTGLLEAGPLCTPISPVCADPSRYMFFDSIHPTEATYGYLTQHLKELLKCMHPSSSRTVQILNAREKGGAAAATRRDGMAS